MAKKRTVAKTHHKSKADWKFIITLLVLVVIGLGIFSIYRKLNAVSPEAYWNFAYDSQNNSRNYNTSGGSGGSIGKDNINWNAIMNERARENRESGVAGTSVTKCDANQCRDGVYQSNGRIKWGESYNQGGGK